MIEEHTIPKRLERLESLIDDQQEIIRDQQTTIERQHRRLEALESRSTAGTGPTANAAAPDAGVDSDCGVDAETDAGSRERSGLQLTRRQTLQAGGIFGLLGLGAVGTAAADPTPTGSVGTDDRPLETLFTHAMSAPGSGLSIETGDGDRALELGVLEEVRNTQFFPNYTAMVGPNVVMGHPENEIDGAYGSVIGGGGLIRIDPETVDLSNRIASNYGTISGGHGNVIESNANRSTIGGGSDHTVSDRYATISGGRNNVASDLNATIGGGENNEASGFSATVAGGFNNEATGAGATVPGGNGNLAHSNHTFAAGRGAVADHDGAFVVGDSSLSSIESRRRDEARFQMSVATEGGFVLDERTEPRTNELGEDEAMLYFDGTDIRYAVNSDGTIQSERLTS